MGSAQNQSLPRSRIFFRIPTKIPAVLQTGSDKKERVIINDLSTTGLSITTQSHRNVFGHATIRFRVPLSFRRITLSVQIMNAGEKRVGCKFSALSPRHQEIIENFLLRSTDISYLSYIFQTAIILLCFDALWRLLAAFINYYYRGSPFFTCFFPVNDPPNNEILLILYAVVCFTAFILTERLSKASFFVSLFCTLLASVFLTSKVIGYIKMGLWGDEISFLRTFFWIEGALALYCLFAVSIALFMSARVIFMLNSVVEYT